MWQCDSSTTPAATSRTITTMAIIMDDGVDPLRRLSALTGNSMHDALWKRQQDVNLTAIMSRKYRLQCSAESWRNSLPFLRPVVEITRSLDTWRRQQKGRPFCVLSAPPSLLIWPARGRGREREERQVFRLVPRTMCALTSVAWHRIGFVLWFFSSPCALTPRQLVLPQIAPFFRWLSDNFDCWPLAVLSNWWPRWSSSFGRSVGRSDSRNRCVRQLAINFHLAASFVTLVYCPVTCWPHLMAVIVAIPGPDGSRKSENTSRTAIGNDCMQGRGRKMGIEREKDS